MAKTKGAKFVDEFERDFIRLMIVQHGWSFGKTAQYLGRPKTTVYKTYQAMKRAGTLDQLPLPGFGIEAGHE
ncbi:hypothetical protein [Ruegeria sp.]|uniref:hypothetical protein n=1 Tax=Ruegeria sp. TaxID=1879320 RepID=UPI003C7993C3